jgi:hypothetical protein
MKPAPKAKEPLRTYLESFGRWSEDKDALTLLKLCDGTRTGLRDYEKQLVRDARRQGATWDDIGKALGIHRQNAYRRFGA